MAEYYTKLEADAKFATTDHTHNIEDLGGTELPASRVAIDEDVSADFGNAYTVDEAFASTKSQLDGKAPTSHTHSGYALSGHTHTPASIGAAAESHTHDYAASDHTHTPASIGAAPASHTHDYAASDHSHSEYSLTTHTHTPASIGAAAASHSHDYAASTHSHAQSEITGLTDALGAKANASALTGKADLVDGKVPASQLPSYVDDVLEYAAVANFPETGETGKIYVATGTNKSYRWSGSAYVELSQSVALGETSSTAYRGDRGKTAYDHSQDGTVHVTAAQKTAWDGKAAGDHTHTPASIGAAESSHTHTPASIGAAAASHTHDYAASNHTHSYNNLTDKPTIPEAYTHPSTHPASMITGLAPVATSGSYDDLTDKPTIPTVPASLPANGGNADTVDGKHASDFATADHTHTPASIGAAATDHTHAAQVITAHLSVNTYNVTVNDDYETVPLTSTVVTGDALTLVGNKIRIGSGVSKVMISGQLCIASGNTEINRYVAVRKNTTTQLVRSQLKLSYVTLPQTMAIAGLLVDVSEGDLLSLDFCGKSGDTIYGNNVLTYLTVEKKA